MSTTHDGVELHGHPEATTTAVATQPPPPSQVIVAVYRSCCDVAIEALLKSATIRQKARPLKTTE